jgi:prepilin-type N-terminal cleavage/methylation domain-containing protein
MNARTPSNTSRGFSLVEMLVVIVIVVSLILIALPAFNSTLNSQERTSSANLLQQGISAARDFAVRSAQGEDSAAVFSFEPGGSMTISTYTKVGEFDDVLAADSTVGRTSDRVVRREVFAPVNTVDPITLPRKWSVRGYALGSQFNSEWYEFDTRIVASDSNRYPQPSTSEKINYWVFPETGFYDHNLANDGGKRQTFMVRFAGGSGKVVPDATEPVLVVMVRPSDAERNYPRELRADLATDIKRWAQRVMQTKQLDTRSPYAPGLPGRPWDNTSDNIRRNLIGSGSGSTGPSSDVATARSVTFLALYDEERLAAALGTRVDRQSRTLYRVDETEVNQGLKIDRIRMVQVTGQQWGGSPDLATAVNRWIEGYKLEVLFSTQLDANLRAGALTQWRADSAEARIFGVDRFTGALRPVRIPGETTENLQ